MIMAKLSLLSSAVLLALASPAWADEAIELETIHVQSQRSYNGLATENNRQYSSSAATVGTKIPTSMREIPQSVSIITQQQLQDRDVDTLDQLARQVSGLRVLSNDDGRSSVYARGYEYDEYNVDGLPAPMQSINGTLPNLVAFDRVEVMRGPSGLFDSSGEMGGIVNLVRKRPTKDLKAHFTAGGGTQKQYKLEADVSGSLNARGSVRGRVLAQTAGHSAKPAEKNNHHETFYAALDWDIAPKTVLGLGYLYQQRHLAPDNGLPAQADGSLLPLPQASFVGASWNKFKMHSHDVFVDLKHYFSHGGYGKIGMRYSERHAASNYAFAGSALKPDNTVTAIGLGTDIQQKALALDASYSQSFQIGQNINEFVVGMDYNQFETRNEQGRTRALAASIPYTDFSSLKETSILDNARMKTRGYSWRLSDDTIKESGIYGKTVLRPVSELSLILGGRVGHYSLSSGNDQDEQRDSKTKLTGYGGIVWDVTPNNSLYASYSMLYRPQNAIDVSGSLLKPRQGSQVEIGYKGSYFDDKLNTRLSLYRLQDKNAAASIVGDNVHYAALGKRVMQGLEAEISGELTDKWQIHAGYHYLHSQVKRASTARDDGIFLLMPKQTFNLWTSYDVTDKLTLGGGVNAVSHFESSAGVRASGYATFDLMAAYRFTPKFKLQVNADNIFDRHYYTRVGSANTFNIAGARRSINATLRYDF